MITIIIFTVLGISIGVYIEHKHGYYTMAFDYIMAGFFGLIVGCSVGVGIGFALPVEGNTVVTLTCELESIQDNNSVSGSFFLGSGQINGSMKYVIYRKTEGGYKMEQLDYTKTIIEYTEGTPKLEVYEKIPTDALINLFAIDASEGQSFIVYVPKGTIKNNFQLDAR